MKAAETLGLLCVGEEDFPYRKLIIVAILNKQHDVSYHPFPANENAGRR